MKKRFTMKKMVALALVIVCVSVPFTSFAHKAWCQMLHCVAYGAAGGIIEATAVSRKKTTSYSNLTSTTHTRTVTETSTCSLCSDEWTSGSSSVNENHSCSRHQKFGSSTIHICGCGQTKTSTSSNHW